MLIEFDLNHLRAITSRAIRQYSEETYSSEWLMGIEFSVLSFIKNTNESKLNMFEPDQILAMRELISRGYWVVYQDGEIKLSSTILNELYPEVNWDMCRNGAD